MSARQLGPERPKPLAVLSEDHIRFRCVLPYVPQHELLTFGQDYENRLCTLINDYLELDTCDKVCYVGETAGSVAPQLQDKFCILEEITSLEPGTVHYEDGANHVRVPIRVPNVGMEEFFSASASNSSAPHHRFDKIIFFDTLRHLHDTRQFFSDVLRHTNDLSKILIVHRAVPINTLPFFGHALKKLQQYDQSFLNVIEELKSLGLEVFWEIESIPVVTNKWKWFSMLKNRFPPELQIVSDFEILQGLRELSEGSLKYSDAQIEFLDRLLFITVQRPIRRHPLLGRVAGPKTEKLVKGLHFEMPLTADIARLVGSNAEKSGSPLHTKSSLKC